ncbi:MAG: hypothetical protein F4X09_00835 [Gammaproteobacteria bacterium]|nr:hypothetical protein [Gammaproteobacteria bacterium]
MPHSKGLFGKMKFLFSFTLILLAPQALAQSDSINLPNIGVGLSGFWYNPDQPAHGLQIEVINGAKAFVSWYTYNSFGQPLWLLGEGTYSGLVLNSELLQFSGGRPPSAWSQADPQVSNWGSVTIEFQSCNSAWLNWSSVDSGFGNGALELIRFSSLMGQQCFAEEEFGQQIVFSFESGELDFQPVFADLPVNFEESIYELDFRREVLPAPLQGFSGLRLTGSNRSDDLAMLVKKAVGGLAPNTTYSIVVDGDIATNTPFGCVGIGGAPGESVTIKFGASTIEPVAEERQPENYFRLNIDFGNQTNGGENGLVVGNLTNSFECSGTAPPWELKSLSTYGEELLISTDSDGVLWLLAGSDSGFEGTSQFYITTLRIRLERQDD